MHWWVQSRGHLVRAFICARERLAKLKNLFRLLSKLQLVHTGGLGGRWIPRMDFCTHKHTSRTHLSDSGESRPEYERDDERDDEGDVVEEVVDARLDGAVRQVEVDPQRRGHRRRHRPQLRCNR